MSEEQTAGCGPVVLDIGGDVGAAVVISDPAADGHEVEIRRQGGQWTGEHVGFARRETASEPMVAAVFPQLNRGRWQVRFRDEVVRGDVLTFAVEGGRITWLALPARRSV